MIINIDTSYSTLPAKWWIANSLPLFVVVSSKLQHNGFMVLKPDFVLSLLDRIFFLVIASFFYSLFVHLVLNSYFL